MPTTTGRRGMPRCLSLLSCWTGCFGNMFPCLAAQPVQQPQMPSIPTLNVGNSIPQRRSFSTDEEYQNALERWRRDGINMLTTHMQDSLTNHTMTPELMEHLKSEIEKINLATARNAHAEASAPIMEEQPVKRCRLCRKCCEGIGFICCFPCRNLSSCCGRKASESPLDQVRGEAVLREPLGVTVITPR